MLDNQPTCNILLQGSNSATQVDINETQSGLNGGTRLKANWHPPSSRLYIYNDQPFSEFLENTCDQLQSIVQLLIPAPRAAAIMWPNRPHKLTDLPCPASQLPCSTPLQTIPWTLSSMDPGGFDPFPITNPSGFGGSMVVLCGGGTQPTRPASLAPNPRRSPGSPRG